jgi:hypothetical protein
MICEEARNIPQNCTSYVRRFLFHLVVTEHKRNCVQQTHKAHVVQEVRPEYQNSFPFTLDCFVSALL